MTASSESALQNDRAVPSAEAPPRVWVRASSLRREGYLQAIQKHADIFEQGYFDTIDKRRSSVVNLRLILFAVHILVFAMLALSLKPNAADSFPTLTSLREILVVISAVLALSIGFLGYHHDVLAEVLTALVKHRSGDDEEIDAMLSLSSGLDAFPLPLATQHYLKPGAGYLLFIRAMGTLAGLLFLMVMIGTIFIRVKVLQAIYLAPAFSPAVAVYVIVFVVMCDLVGLLIFLANAGPIRVRKSRGHG